MPKEFEKGKRYCFSHTQYNAWCEGVSYRGSWAESVPRGAEVSIKSSQKAEVTGINELVYDVAPAWCEELKDESKETPYVLAKSQVRLNLRKGKENALSRQRLKQITGLKDRTNRYIIEELRVEGVPIISTSANKGYWLPETVGEMNHYISEFHSRGKRCNCMAALAEQWLHEHANELEDA